MGHQYLVGGISCALGLVSLAAAVQNIDWFFQLAKLRMLEDCVGRAPARWICGLFGCVLIALGLCIAAGWLPPRMPSASHAYRGSRELGAWLPC